MSAVTINSTRTKEFTRDIRNEDCLALFNCAILHVTNSGVE